MVHKGGAMRMEGLHRMAGGVSIALAGQTLGRQRPGPIWNPITKSSSSARFSS